MKAIPTETLRKQSRAWLLDHQQRIADVLAEKGAQGAQTAPTPTAGDTAASVTHERATRKRKTPQAYKPRKHGARVIAIERHGKYVYRVERWWENGVRRSKSLGKVE